MAIKIGSPRQLGFGRFGQKGINLLARARCCLLAGMMAFTAFGGLHAQSAPQIWFSPTDPSWRSIRRQPPNDFNELFRSDTAWSGALSNVRVFELTKRYIQLASDSDLSMVLASLKRHHVALAIQMTPLTFTRACGMAVEGYGPPSEMTWEAERIKQLGGVVAYADMDEPLYYGHRFKGRPPLVYETHSPTPCHSPIADLARQTAVKAAQLRAVFPSAQIGDTEPLGVEPRDEWSDDFTKWVAAYRAAVGQPLAFVHFDCVWWRPAWQPELLDTVKILKENAIPLGVIYNGAPQDATDISWTTAAVQHFQYVEGDLGILPAQAVFMSWTNNPTRILPEDEPGTHANLVLQYVQWRASH